MDEMSQPYLYNFLFDFMHNKRMIEKDEGYNTFINTLLNGKSIYSVAEDDLLSEVDRAIETYARTPDSFVNQLEVIKEQIGLTIAYIDRQKDISQFDYFRILGQILWLIDILKRPELIVSVPNILALISSRSIHDSTELKEYKMALYPTVFKSTFTLCYQELQEALQDKDKASRSLPYASENLEKILDGLNEAEFLEAHHAQILLFLFLTVSASDAAALRYIEKYGDIVTCRNVGEINEMGSWYIEPISSRLNIISKNHKGFRMLIRKLCILYYFSEFFNVLNLEVNQRNPHKPRNAHFSNLQRPHLVIEEAAA